MILSQEQQDKNKSEFLDLFDRFNLPSDKVDKFKSWVCNSDFFEAPASTKNHLACRGGLCQHTLNVIRTSFDLCNKFTPDVSGADIFLASALHDISKTNYYELYTKNEKQYCQNGTKVDDRGRTFNWVSVDGYKVKDASERFVFASHAQNSEFMARHFFDISTEVSCAILHHMGPYDDASSSTPKLSEIYSNHPLASIIHMADFISSHILDEKGVLNS